jgi:NADH:ubiquinone oxidoreductase subunit C
MKSFKKKTAIHFDSVNFLLEKIAPGKIFFLKEQNRDLYFFVSLDSLSFATNFIKHSSFFQCKQLIDIIAVDLFSSKYFSVFSGDYFKKTPRFEINYQFLSIVFQRRVFFKVLVMANEQVPSQVPFFESANWLEREMWDLFGIISSGHPDLRRILTDYGFQGHPLRKDFPLSGFLDVEYSISKKRVFFKNVSLMHEYRNFHFSNPWKSKK